MKNFPKNQKKRLIPLFSMTTFQPYNNGPKLAPRLFGAPKPQTISLHFELLWGFLSEFILCSLLIVVVKVL